MFIIRGNILHAFPVGKKMVPSFGQSTYDRNIYLYQFTSSHSKGVCTIVDQWFVLNAYKKV